MSWLSSNLSYDLFSRRPYRVWYGAKEKINKLKYKFHKISQTQLKIVLTFHLHVWALHLMEDFSQDSEQQVIIQYINTAIFISADIQCIMYIYLCSRVVTSSSSQSPLGQTVPPLHWHYTSRHLHCTTRPFFCCTVILV